MEFMTKHTIAGGCEAMQRRIAGGCEAMQRRIAGGCEAMQRRIAGGSDYCASRANFPRCPRAIAGVRP
jgi:hypothetical protein